MFFVLVENFVFLSALLTLPAFLLAFIPKIVVKKNLNSVSPSALTRIYAALILFPPIFALWIVSASLLPEKWVGTDVLLASHVSPVHEWHLLTDLTASFEPFLAFATVFFLIAVSLFIFWKSLRNYFKIAGVVRFLEIEASVPSPEKTILAEQIAAQHGIKVGLLMSEQPLTFVWGFWQSKLVISSGLLNLLTENELRGVIEHEAAHHIRRDNLIKFLLSAAVYLSPVFPLTRKILNWHSEQTEFVCDEIAAAATNQPLEIASALVKIRRNFPAYENAMPATSGFFGNETNSIELRIQRLLLLADSALSGRPLRLVQKPLFEFSAIAILFIGSILCFMFFAPLVVHQTAETLINTFRQ